MNFTLGFIFTILLIFQVTSIEIEELDEVEEIIEEDASPVSTNISKIYIGSPGGEEKTNNSHCFPQFYSKFPKVEQCSEEDTKRFLQQNIEQQVNILSQGVDGEVFKFIRPSDGAMVAVKKRFDHSCEGEKKFYREVQLMSRFKGDGITANIYCTFHDRSGNQYYMMEFLPGKRLSTAEYYHPRTDNFNAKWGELCSKMASIMIHLHEKGVVHLDAHLNNWMLTPDGRLYIIDFSRARNSGLFVNARADAKILRNVFLTITRRMLFALGGSLGPEAKKDVDFEGISDVLDKLRTSKVKDAIKVLELFEQKHKRTQELLHQF